MLVRNPINTLCFPLQYPVLDHASAECSGVRVELGDEGEGWFNGNGDEGAIRLTF